jgi:hypothetical protein
MLIASRYTHPSAERIQKPGHRSPLCMPSFEASDTHHIGQSWHGGVECRLVNGD